MLKLSICCQCTLIYIQWCTELFSTLALLSCNNASKDGNVIGRQNSRQDQVKWIAMQHQEEQFCEFRADVSVSCMLYMSTWSNVKSWTNSKNTKCEPSCRLLPGADTSELITSMKFRRAYSSSLPRSVHAEPRFTRSNSEPHLLATATWHMTKEEGKTQTSTMSECRSSSRQWSFVSYISFFNISWFWVKDFAKTWRRRRLCVCYLCIYSILTNDNSEARS